MTTAAAPLLLDPPATPAAELAPLLDDRERACEMRDAPFGDACGQPAQWTFTAKCEPCGTTERVLLCEPCRIELADRFVPRCSRCRKVVAASQLERL